MACSYQKMICLIMKIPNLILILYGILRMVTCIIHNFYCIPAYLFINAFLIPVYYLSTKTYSNIENSLFYSLLYIVGWWSYGCGMVVYEHGDDLSKLRRENPKGRVLMIANHQSTSDVPLMFQVFASKGEWNLLWIMDRAFKWTHFGVISQIHGDYFINPKNYISNSILNHCRKEYSMWKDLIIIFPEGGFRYKRLQSSIAYGTKRNYPNLYNVTYPRVNGFRELLNEDLKITHVVDLTICYDSPDLAPSILDVLRGIHSTDVHFHYRVHDVQSTNNINSDEWLYEQWQMKEALLTNHYSNIKDSKRRKRGKNNCKLNLTNGIVGFVNEPSTSFFPVNDDENLLKLNNNNNHYQDNNEMVRSTPAPLAILKFRPYYQFSSLKFDIERGRPTKLNFFKVIFFHLAYLFISTILYMFIFHLISMF